MQDNHTAIPKAHLQYLDSARGIAALMVMIYHYNNRKYLHHIVMKLAAFIFNGSDAVSFFFVLSGFVLSYKYIVLNQPLDIRKFYITRFFRLWPAFFVCILINALDWLKHDMNWHNLAEVFIYNKTGFWQEASLIRAHVYYFGAGWTLVIELALSFFIPFLIVLAKKDTRLLLWLLVATLFLQGNMGEWYIFHFHFILGVLLSCLYNFIESPQFRETAFYRLRHLILGVAIVFFSVRHIDTLVPFGDVYYAIAQYIRLDFFHFTGLASFVFLILIMSSTRAKAILQNKVLVFFGKISYGIYLMHWVVVTNIFVSTTSLSAAIGNEKLAFVVIFFIYACLTISLATLSYYLVEQPFMKLGKRLTGKMRGSYVVA